MRLEFNANLVGVEREFAVTAGFAVEAGGKLQEQILISRSLPDVEVIPGIEGVCTVRGEQRYVLYGGITRASLTSDSLSLCFTEAASTQLGGVTELVAYYPANHVSELNDALAFIFQGCGCYEHRT